MKLRVIAPIIAVVLIGAGIGAYFLFSGSDEDATVSVEGVRISYDVTQKGLPFEGLVQFSIGGISSPTKVDCKISLSVHCETQAIDIWSTIIDRELGSGSHNLSFSLGPGLKNELSTGSAMPMFAAMNVGNYSFDVVRADLGNGKTDMLNLVNEERLSVIVTNKTLLDTGHDFTGPIEPWTVQQHGQTEVFQRPGYLEVTMEDGSRFELGNPLVDTALFHGLHLNWSHVIGVTNDSEMITYFERGGDSSTRVGLEQDIMAVANSTVDIPEMLDGVHGTDWMMGIEYSGPGTLSFRVEEVVAYQRYRPVLVFVQDHYWQMGVDAHCQPASVRDSPEASFDFANIAFKATLGIEYIVAAHTQWRGIVDSNSVYNLTRQAVADFADNIGGTIGAWTVRGGYSPENAGFDVLVSVSNQTADHFGYVWGNWSHTGDMPLIPSDEDSYDASYSGTNRLDGDEPPASDARDRGPTPFNTVVMFAASENLLDGALFLARDWADKLFQHELSHIFTALDRWFPEYGSSIMTKVADVDLAVEQLLVGESWLQVTNWLPEDKVLMYLALPIY